jgi:hypothetical protein
MRRSSRVTVLGVGLGVFTLENGASARTTKKVVA